MLFRNYTNCIWFMNRCKMTFLCETRKSILPHWNLIKFNTMSRLISGYDDTSVDASSIRNRMFSERGTPTCVISFKLWATCLYHHHNSTPCVRSRPVSNQFFFLLFISTSDFTHLMVFLLLLLLIDKSIKLNR